MTRRLLGIALLSAAVLLSAPLAAQADEVWNFFGPQSPFPSAVNSGVVLLPPYPLSVTNADGYIVQLTPYRDTSPTLLPAFLTGKDEGAGSDERGVGICAESACTSLTSSSNNTEINGTEALKIDLSSAAAAGLHGFQIRFNSLAGGDTAHLWAGSVGGTSLGTVNHVNAEFESFNIPDIYDTMSIFITADSGDVLVYGVAALATPEPSTLLLLGSGLMGLGGFARIRRRRG